MAKPRGDSRSKMAGQKQLLRTGRETVISRAAAAVAKQCRAIDKAWPDAELNDRRRLVRRLVGELHHAYLGYTGEVLGPSLATLIEALDCLQGGAPHVLFASIAEQPKAEQHKNRSPDAIIRLKGMAAAVLEHCSRLDPGSRKSYAKRIARVLFDERMPGPGRQPSYGHDAIVRWLADCSRDTEATSASRLGIDYHYRFWKKVFAKVRLVADQAVERLRSECNSEFGRR
jgi:hypothetical protein